MHFMPSPETYIKVKSGVSLRCAGSILTGAYMRLATRCAPVKNDYTACHPGKATTYVLHVVPITTHTPVRLKSNGRKETKKEEKSKKKEEKDKTRQEEQAKGRK